MKIAFVCQPQDQILPPYQNSIGLWVYEIACRLSGRHSITIYVGASSRGLRKRVERWDGLQYCWIPMLPDRLLLRLLKPFSSRYRLRCPLFASSLYYLAYGLQVARDLRRQGYDLVHLINYSQLAPLIRAFNPKIKIVLHMHCEWLSQLDPVMIERRLKSVDLVLGCSDHITNKVRLRFPHLAGRCQTIFNGVDAKQFRSKQDYSSDLKGGVQRLLFVGRVSPEKGLHTLLAALPEIVKYYPQAQLEILGSQRQLALELLVGLSDDARVSKLASFYNGKSHAVYFSQLQEQLVYLNLSRHVTFSGSVSHAEIIKRYQNADVFVQPSFSDAFPFTILEAMAIGLPVVASRVGGIPEAVTEGRTGLLVEPGDASALAQAMLQFLSNEQLRRTMGEAARKRIIEHFSWDKLVESLSCLYQKIDQVNHEPIFFRS